MSPTKPRQDTRNSWEPTVSSRVGADTGLNSMCRRTRTFYFDSVRCLFALTFLAGTAYADDWITVFDLKLQVGDKDSVSREPPTMMLGGLLTLPKDFSAWSCTAGSVFDSRVHASTRYLECVAGKSTIYTQVTCQTRKADNNSSSMFLRTKKGRTAVLSLSCQSFVSNPALVETPDSEP